eukprot:12468327-Ditylum_brightwellii.AAC.1
MHVLQSKSGNKRSLGTMQVNGSQKLEGVISLTFHQASRIFSYKTIPHPCSSFCAQGMATEYTDAIHTSHSC